jgi:hypothetical protein
VIVSEGVDIVSLTNSWVARDACTLPTLEQPTRVAEFDALFANHTTGVERVTPTRLVLTLNGERDLARQVKDLTDRESLCCSFFTFAVSTDEGSNDMSAAVLYVELPAARADVLNALAEHANASRPPGPA